MVDVFRLPEPPKRPQAVVSSALCRRYCSGMCPLCQGFGAFETTLVTMWNDADSACSLCVHVRRTSVAVCACVCMMDIVWWGL